MAAVEWFHKETWNLKIKLEKKEISIGEFAVIYYSLLKQAKEMENQQRGYSEEIINILENIMYWDTCPEDYKETISIFITQFKNK